MLGVDVNVFRGDVRETHFKLICDRERAGGREMEKSERKKKKNLDKKKEMGK
jgi:hypothetical protein